MLVVEVALGHRWLFRMLWPVFVFNNHWWWCCCRSSFFYFAPCSPSFSLFAMKREEKNYTVNDCVFDLLLDAMPNLRAPILVAHPQQNSRLKNYTKYCNFPFQPKHIMWQWFGTGTFNMRSVCVCDARSLHIFTSHYTTIMFLVLSVMFLRWKWV